MLVRGSAALVCLVGRLFSLIVPPTLVMQGCIAMLASCFLVVFRCVGVMLGCRVVHATTRASVRLFVHDIVVLSCIKATD